MQQFSDKLILGVRNRIEKLILRFQFDGFLFYISDLLFRQDIWMKGSFQLQSLWKIIEVVDEGIQFELFLFFLLLPLSADCVPNLTLA